MDRIAFDSQDVQRDVYVRESARLEDVDVTGEAIIEQAEINADVGPDALFPLEGGVGVLIGRVRLRIQVGAVGRIIVPAYAAECQ